MSSPVWTWHISKKGVGETTKKRKKNKQKPVFFFQEHNAKTFCRNALRKSGGWNQSKPPAKLLRGFTADPNRGCSCAPNTVSLCDRTVLLSVVIGWNQTHLLDDITDWEQRPMQFLTIDNWSTVLLWYRNGLNVGQKNNCHCYIMTLKQSVPENPHWLLGLQCGKTI